MSTRQTIVIIFGASGDLSRKKIIPALWSLFKMGKFLQNVKIVGFARSNFAETSFYEIFKPFCQVQENENEMFEQFKKYLTYYNGSYDSDCFDKFQNHLNTVINTTECDRIFYVALPPSAYINVASLIHKHCCGHTGKTRIVFEKPFGYDLDSAIELNKTITNLYSEHSIYRIDHYLGKEMVQNILVLRLSNFLISSIWNKDFISSIVVNFKEDIGTYGRGNYYDASGVIRDILQNHTIQVVSLLAMEPPKTLESKDVQEAKINVLRQFVPIKLEDIVIGQYVGDSTADPKSPAFKGYKDDSLVPKDSTTPTYATIIAYIDNERWRGVPFILKAGKALNERKSEIRVQFKPTQLKLFNHDGANELVIRMQPDEAIYLKIMTRLPGLGFELSPTELDLTFKDRHKDAKPYDAYVKLILDIFQGSHINFVRSEELEESWKLFTPVLENICNGKVPLYQYTYGSRGPTQADELLKKIGFVYDPKYKWTKGQK